MSPREESGFRSGAVGSHTGLLFCFVFVSYIEVYLTHTEKSTNYKCARLQVFTRGGPAMRSKPERERRPEFPSGPFRPLPPP